MSRPTHARTGGTIRGRVLASLADAVAVGGGVAVLESLRERRSAPRPLPVLVGTALVAVPYHGLLEGATGRTAGKRPFGLVVRRAG